MLTEFLAFRTYSTRCGTNALSSVVPLGSCQNKNDIYATRFSGNKARHPRVFHCLVALVLDALRLTKKGKFPRTPFYLFLSQPLHQMILYIVVAISSFKF